MAIKKAEGEFACVECEGTGQAVPDCEACGGLGWVEDDEDGGTKTCPECGDDRCDFCKGTGEKATSPAL